MGRLPLEEALAQYDWADVLAFTSLRDTVGTVVPEALSYGVPLIALGHQGVAGVVTDDCAVKIPVTTPGQVEREFADAIARLARDRAEVERLSRGAVERSRQYLWSRNGEAMEEVYAGVLARRDRASGQRTGAGQLRVARAAGEARHDGRPSEGHAG